MKAKDSLGKGILEDFEGGKLRRSRNASQEIKYAKEAASNYLRKNNRINIRLSGADLNLLKRKAVQEGMPYQTLIASVLHKFAMGH